MKSFFVFLFFLIFEFLATTPPQANACLDTTTFIVGTVKKLITRYHKMPLEYYTPAVRMCFIPSLDKGKNFGVKYFGIRVPGNFRMTSIQSHKVIKLGRHWRAGQVIAFDYRADRLYCVVLHPLHGQSIWVKGPREKEHTLMKVGPKQALLAFHDIINTSANHKTLLNNVTRRLQRPGITVGSEFFYGSSGAKGGCGATEVPWTKKKKLPPPKPKAKVEDFE